jgi:hypothetical protein
MPRRPVPYSEESSLEAAPDACIQSRFRRAQIGVAALGALAVAALIARAALVSPDAPFLVRSDAPWIVAPTPIQTHGMVIDRAEPPLAIFARPFEAAAAAGPVTLHVRALREVTLFLNDRELPLAPADPGAWKRARSIDLAPHLADGRNVLAAKVSNPDGNPALQIWIEGLPERIETDARWLAAFEGDPAAFAALAEDSVRHPDAALLPAPWSSLAALWPSFALCGVAGIALFFALRRAPPALARRAPLVAAALAALFFAIVLRRVLEFPAHVGFDARAHLDYVDWIAQRGSLPKPSDGGLMYHPPLYHALSALLLRLLAPFDLGRHAIVSILPMLSGLGMACVAGALARALWPAAPWLAAGAIAATALLPMNVILAACASNEGPFALFASLALLVAVRALVRPATRRDDLWLGVWLGAAALTKYTVLLWAPPLIGAVALKRLAFERSGAARALGGAALAGGIAAALGGWFYARNWWIAGNPLVWSLDAIPGRSWWQLPGFHTLDYFVRFGDSFTHPWFASFHSFWDSLYSTLWGDGLLSGAVGPAEAVRRWRYEPMAAGFLLAVPATLLLFAGWLRALCASLRDGDLGRRLALALLVVFPPLFVATLVNGILHYPFWSGVKAFYALSVTPILGLLGALGFDALDGWLAARAPALRALPWAWAAAFLASILWSYAG